ncbi:hypothetical protein HOLleu_38894 [Holothuria leucospilota]|uniref:Peptidase A2 domain-containing protein n=1 Tax=Holothuria leucospilota TaxID=206669 RepID=A0A9Q1BCL2_HOLLE|nr:hypothetical protein HOLleu_38894 [Holothuria leucospilota]
MPFNLDKFVASPSVEELDSLKKSEIVKVAKHYGVEFQPLMRKDEIKRYVLEYLVDESILPITVLETAITVPTDNTFELKRLEIEMNKEIRLKEMERERMQMQKEKEEREMQMQREKEAREHEFRLKQLELGVIKGSDPKIGLDTGGLFDVSKHVKFVPKFQEDNVEKFFNHFEKLGEQRNSGSQSGSISPTNSGKKQPDLSRQKNDQVSSNKAAFKDITCGFCHKKGHTMANCFTLAKLKETETASNALANVENSSEVVVTLRPNSNDKIKEEYLPFVSEGFISLDGNSAHPPVKIKILRDTGATQSLLLDGVLPLSDSTSTGANVLIQGVECGFISVPLHKINLKSDLVSGSVIVGVRPTLPVKGVSLLLGNDLAGGKVVANAILTDKPCDYNNTEQLEKEFPNLFPACAVTRAMSQKLAVDDNLKHPPSNSEDTVPKSGTSKESCKDDNLKHPLSKNEGMISENKDDKLNHPPSKIEELVPKNGTALPKEESESGKDSSKNIHESEDSWYDLSQSFMTNLNDSQDWGECYKTTRQKHRIESIDERMESSREFNFNAAFLELSRSENCLRYVPITTTVCSRSFY